MSLSGKDANAVAKVKFNGSASHKANFAIWFSRLTSKIHKKGPNCRAAVRGLGVFKGLSYDPNVVVLLGDPEPKKEGEGTKQSGDDEKQSPDQIQSLHNFYCEVVWDIEPARPRLLGRRSIKLQGSA